MTRPASVGEEWAAKLRSEGLERGTCPSSREHPSWLCPVHYVSVRKGHALQAHQYQRLQCSGWSQGEKKRREPCRLVVPQMTVPVDVTRLESTLCSYDALRRFETGARHDSGRLVWQESGRVSVAL